MAYILLFISKLGLKIKSLRCVSVFLGIVSINARYIFEYYKKETFYSDN